MTSASSTAPAQPSSPLLLLAMMVLSPLSLVTAFVRGGSAAYCDDNLFAAARNDERAGQLPGVQFTKELSATEYGSLSSFKKLHCCGENYLSLEWFKDNRSYPWPSDVSSFILNPESANQTIYTRSLTSADHGVYTCQLANQTSIVNHSIKLVTIDVTSYSGEPLPTYKIPNDHYAQPGDSVRLYCEGFVGKVNLPDAVNTIKWKKIDGNETFSSEKKYKIEEVRRENNQVLGAFLFINKIQETDYGQYMCSISNADDQIVEQFTNITLPVFNIEQLNTKKVQRDLRFIIFVMLALILVVWKRRWFYLVYEKLKKKLENDKYTLSEKTVHNIIVFYDEVNKDNAQYLVENMERYDNFITKKYYINFEQDFIKTHKDLVKGYDFAIYLVSSNDTITSSLSKSNEKSFMQDNASPKNYIIDCGNMPVTPTKSWCDRVLTDLTSEHTKRNQNTTNKLLRVV